MANLRMAKRKDIYEYLILGWNKFHFVQKKTQKKPTNYNKKLTDTIKMLESFNRKSAFYGYRLCNYIYQLVALFV